MEIKHDQPFSLAIHLGVILVFLAGCIPTPVLPAPTAQPASTPGAAAGSTTSVTQMPATPSSVASTPPPAAFTPTATPGVLLTPIPSQTLAPLSATCPTQTAPGAASALKDGVKLAMSLPENTNPALDALVEFDLATTVQVKNPFDPSQIDLVVNYTGPDGKVMTIPAFWFQAYDPSGSVPCGNPGWKARLTPTRAGQWTAQAEIRNLKVKSAPVSFTVAAKADARGFVRINKTNPHYLAFDNGATYFPIGLNIGWWKSDPLGDYQHWLDQFHANGGSLIRVWMASWSFGVEWQDTGLGDYTKREKHAWLLDQVFNMATQRDINIDLVLLNHGAFSQTTNPEWDSNPYNVANGGMCQTPDCFATNAQAQDYFCKMRKDWRPLEHVSIQEFLIAKGGSSIFEKFWKPLLKAKFDGQYENIPMTYIWSRVRRMASTRRTISQREVMGHIKGNVQIIVDTLQRNIHELGSTILTGVTVRNVAIENGVVQGVVVGNQISPHDVVISTLPHPQYQQLLPEVLRDKERSCVEYMGVVSILLLMRNRLTPFHTLNLVDGTTPYTGIIETTNVIDPALMNGRHLVYVPKYLSPLE